MLPVASDTPDGNSAMETSWSWTIRVVDPLSPPKFAEILVSPVPVLPARPGVELPMVATVTTEELQLALAVTSPDVPSL